jgi:hypothetical protein
MFQKLTLMTLMILGVLPNSTQANDGASTVVAVGATAMVVGTTVYLAYRESNASLIQRAYKLIDAYEGSVQRHLIGLATSKDIAEFASKPAAFKKDMMLVYDQVEDIYGRLGNRYCSWVTPWNWTPEMKQAYKDIKRFHQELKVIKMMFQYALFLPESITEQTVVQTARMVSSGASAYPIIYCVDTLTADIAFIRSLNFYLPCGQIYIELLDKAKSILLASKAYADDRHEYQKHQDQIRAIQAAEAQACAQRRQAEALEERNRIEKERNARRG